MRTRADGHRGSRGGAHDGSVLARVPEGIAAALVAFCVVWLGAGVLAALGDSGLPGETTRDAAWAGLPVIGLALALVALRFAGRGNVVPLALAILLLPFVVVYWTWLGVN